MPAGAATRTTAMTGLIIDMTRGTWLRAEELSVERNSTRLFDLT